MEEFLSLINQLKEKYGNHIITLNPDGHEQLKFLKEALKEIGISDEKIEELFRDDKIDVDKLITILEKNIKKIESNMMDFLRKSINYQLNLSTIELVLFKDKFSKMKKDRKK